MYSDVESDILFDMSVLTALSVFVHYLFGIYGIAGAILVLSGLQHQHGSIAYQLFVRRVIALFVERPTTAVAMCIQSIWSLTLPNRSFENNEMYSEENRANEFDTSDETQSFDSNSNIDEFGESGINTSHWTNEDASKLKENDESDLQHRNKKMRASPRATHLPQLQIRDLTGDNSLRRDSDQSSRASSTSSDGSLIEMNSRTPIHFENDLFVGQAYFLVRTNPEDSYWSRLFQGRRRMFWIQLQGRFKKPPKGTIYLGGELPGSISPGLFTKSIAMVIIGIIRRLVGSVYITFGNTATNQLPSVSFPLYQSVDQFAVTPEGEIPPELGTEEFGETVEDRDKRKATPVGSESYEVGPTYSFHFHTMYVDLTQWKTANIPGMADMSLNKFFDTLPLRLISYDCEANVDTPHSQSEKEYLFCFEVSYDANNKRDEDDRDIANFLLRGRSESSNSDDSTSSASTTSVSTIPLGCVPQSSVNLSCKYQRVLADVDLSYCFWMEEVDIRSGYRRIRYVFSMHLRNSKNLHKKKYVILTTGMMRQLLLRNNSWVKESSNKSLQAQLHFHRRSRIGLYSTITEEACFLGKQFVDLVNRAGQDPIRVTGADVQNVYDDELSPQTDSKMSLDYTQPVEEKISKNGLCKDEDITTELRLSIYQTLLARNSLYPTGDTTSFTPSSLGVNFSKRDREAMDTIFEGIVYRFYSPNLLRQEVLVITKESLHFYRSFSRVAEKNILCRYVTGVHAVEFPYNHLGKKFDVVDETDEITLETEITKSSNPMICDSFSNVFQIKTIAEEIFICVATEQAQDAWIQAILRCSKSSIPENDNSLALGYPFPNPMQPLNRNILNSKNYFPNESELSISHPLQIVTKALKSALAVHLLESPDISVTSELLDTACTLRTIDLSWLSDPNRLSQEEKMAFYLNLYHTILAHAMIVFGYPRGKKRWETFTKTMCYAIGRPWANEGYEMIVSLADIEHLILRSRFPDASLPYMDVGKVRNRIDAYRLMKFGVVQRDFRVAFALAINQEPKGKGSMHANVPVFTPEKLHKQLNALATEFLKDAVHVDIPRKTIYLPQVCEWYSMDFSKDGSAIECVRKLLGFLSENTQADIHAVLDSPFLIHIKFSSFSFTPKSILHMMPDIQE